MTLGSSTMLICGVFSVAFIEDQFHRKCSGLYQFLKWVSKVPWYALVKLLPHVSGANDFPESCATCTTAFRKIENADLRLFPEPLGGCRYKHSTHFRFIKAWRRWHGKMPVKQVNLQNNFFSIGLYVSEHIRVCLHRFIIKLTWNCTHFSLPQETGFQCFEN